MPKRFIKGNTYVFTKKNFIKISGKLKFGDGWVNEVNGNRVTIKDEDLGIIRGWHIVPRWCKCIKVGQAKDERAK